jgi:glycine/D-amino acid oxidase-like deaminating enzyme/nitrite reductase/ring-hydroxylating ferredoxin subunit
MDTVETTAFAPLTKDAEADVCIVGAGIAGLTTAYQLLSKGKSVIVLDDGPVGGGETERTTAHITNVLDAPYFQLEKMHGKEGATVVAESHTDAIHTIEHIVGAEKIDCQFERLNGYLFLGPNEDRDFLERELKAAHEVGLTDVRLLERVPLDCYDFGPCLLFPRQAQFHPLKYLNGLSASMTQGGGKIYLGTHVSGVKGGTEAHVTTSNGHTVCAKAIVVATNAPINDGFPIYTKQSAYRTYVLAARIPHDSVTLGLYWDTQDPYHYIRTESLDDHDLLIVGGEDHRTGEANDAPLRYERLEQWSRSRFPMMGEIEYRWSGQVMEPSDGVAMIGRNPFDEDNVYLVTGDSGNGMTHGTIAGILLADLILGKENTWEKLYSPSRFPHALTEFTKENMNTACQMTAWLTGGSKMPTNRIPLDSGSVIRRGMKKVALYCDKDGKTHELSAVCPHKGCIVAWNSLEKTWDCPCHGSRFAKTGEVINGPSISDMKKL